MQSCYESCTLELLNKTEMAEGINFVIFWLRFLCTVYLKVHKNENFFGFDFEFCTISLLVMSKY